jgi:hypothetical protein
MIRLVGRERSNEHQSRDLQHDKRNYAPVNVPMLIDGGTVPFM